MRYGSTELIMGMMFASLSTFIMTFIYIGSPSVQASVPSSVPAKQVKAQPKQDVKAQDEIRVMVIDTGIDPHPMLKDWIQYEKTEAYIDRGGHGTHVTGILIYGNQEYKGGAYPTNDALCKNVKIYSCKYFDKVKQMASLGAGINCIKKAIALQVDYINYSGGGSSYEQEEYDIMKRFTEGGGKIYAAAGNEGWDLRVTHYFPASYGLPYGSWEQLPGVIPVANIYRDETLVGSSNRAPHLASEVGYQVMSTLPDSSYGFMTGTSQASPAALHTILKRKCESLKAKK